MNLPSHRRTGLVCLLIGLVGLPISTSLAAVTVSGDVSPVDPATWNNSDVYVGDTGVGSVTVDGGSVVTTGSSNTVYVGYNAGADGTVTVNGAGATWAGIFVIGDYGNGTLNITNGGKVSGVAGIGGYSGTVGTMNVDGVGSTCVCPWGVTVGGSGGVASLNIANGGTLVSDSRTLMRGPNATLSVDGTGSACTIAGDIDFYEGTLKITNGGTVNDGSAILGYYETSSTGTVTVSGAGSTWVNSGSLQIGAMGSGTLNIADGGTVTAGPGADTTVASLSGGTSVINFNNGTLTTGGGFMGAAADLTGIGAINAHGLVTDANLIFDATHGLQQSIVLNSLPGQNITINLDVSNPASNGSLGAGYGGTGSLRIADGMSVTSTNGYLGYLSGSNGAATVDGAGSTWTISQDLYVGGAGNGTLNISNGATVTVSQDTMLSPQGGSGVINFNNGVLNTPDLFSPMSALTGTGTINTHGLVADGAVVFDSHHGVQQVILLSNSPGQNVTLNIDLSNPSNNGTLGAGDRGVGSLQIDDGVAVTSSGGYLGYGSGSTGVGIVSGPGSKWTVTESLSNLGIGNLNVGESGNGTLNITNGGTVSCSSAIIVAHQFGSAGAVAVDGAGSTLTASWGLFVGYDGDAALNITNGGLVVVPYAIYIAEVAASTAVVSVDGPGSTCTCGGIFVGGEGAGPPGNATLNITHGGTVNSGGGWVASAWGGLAVATIDGTGSAWTIGGSLYIGNGEAGTLNVTNGGALTSSQGYIGGGAIFGLGAATASIDGIGSTWADSGVLDVGSGPSGGSGGTLKITNGASVSSGDTIIGMSSSITVDGIGSTWVGGDSLSVGESSYSRGTLYITRGGVVSAGSVSILPFSLLAMDVGRASQMTVGNGSGTISISGTVCLAAGPAAVPGVYTPISAGTWQDIDATYQALGGQWHRCDHTFTVSSIQTGLAGQPLSIDLATTQRLLVVDPATASVAAAGFQGTHCSSPLTFSANTMSAATLSAFQTALGGGATVPAGWQFSASGAYTSGDPVYLSMSIGSGYSVNGMQIWQYDGTNWAPYAASLLNYDGTYANFAATGLTSYAVAIFDHPTLNNATLYVTSDASLGPLASSPVVNLTFTGNATLQAETVASPITLNANRGIAIAPGVTASVSTYDSLTIAGAISGAGALNKLGSGTLYLTGNNTYTGGTTVSAGTLQTKQVTNSLTIANGATTILTGSAGHNPHASVINGLSNLSISTTSASPGVLDLTDNGLIITGATAADESTIASYISNGQIISSVVAAANAAHPGSMTIAYDFASNIGLTFTSGSATWGGQTISQAAAGSDLLILPTVVGDLNLDGAVNFTDVVALVPNLGKSSGQTWASGDLNGDGAVNVIDVTMLAPNLGKTVAGMPADVALSSEAVVAPAPEPASLALLMLGGLLVLPRRR